MRFIAVLHWVHKNSESGDPGIYFGFKALDTIHLGLGLRGLGLESLGLLGYFLQLPP